ncbi:MAG: SPFH domain-containing protein [Oscillospiraceae bacterium]|nr:SPFH domain-containing protein [Oscillospiraceae bacterium]
MGFGDFIKGQFIDVIEHVDESNKLLVYKFTRYGDEIKQGARLIVRNGQCAVFVCKGQIADIFLPGNYKLSTGNLPVLSSLAALPSLFNSPIKSDLYFVNTTQFINNRWGTKNPIIKRDEELGMVRVTAFGTFSFRVKDAKVFMTEVFGARSLNMTYDIIQYLTSMVSEAVGQRLGESTVSILDLATHYRELSGLLTPFVNEKAEPLGLEIANTSVENIGLPKEVEAMIDEQSGIGLASRNMDTFVQYQSARAIRDAAKQPGGLSGLGAGLAVGRVVSKNIDRSLDDAPTQSSDQKETDSAKTTDAIADQILKYKKLLDAGVLTQEEFEKVKAKLLTEIM